MNVSTTAEPRVSPSLPNPQPGCQGARSSRCARGQAFDEFAELPPKPNADRTLGPKNFSYQQASTIAQRQSRFNARATVVSRDAKTEKLHLSNRGKPRDPVPRYGALQPLVC